MRLLPFLVCALLAFSQEEPLLFKTEVSLVRVDARVSLSGGSTVERTNGRRFCDLRRGRPGKAGRVHTESQPMPVNVLLLLDVSDSMRPYLRELSEKATEALGVLRPGDQVAVMLFSQNSELVQPFTTELRTVSHRIVNSIYKQQLGRTTFVNEALMRRPESCPPKRRDGHCSLLPITRAFVTWRAIPTC